MGLLYYNEHAFIVNVRRGSRALLSVSGLEAEKRALIHYK
ncbi:MAG: hypothetical protein RL681_471 [Candidatus Parcubacteria bacterium]|jgi:hypothetical protein